MIISVFSDEILKDYREAIPIIAGWNSKYIDFRGLVNGKGIEFQTNDELYEMKSLLDQYGLKAAAIQSSLCKVHLPDKERQEQELQKLEGILRAADILDCRLVRCFNYWQPKKEEYGSLIVHPDLFQRVLDMFMPIAKRAGREELHLSFECCGQSPEEVIAVIDALGNKNFGMAWDVSNNYEREPLVDHSKKFGLYLKYSNMIHVKSRSILPEILDFPVPWEKVFELMIDSGKHIPVSIETHNPKNSPFTHEQATRMCYEKTVKLYSTLLSSKTDLYKRPYHDNPVSFVVVGLGMGYTRAKQIQQTSGTKLAGVCDINLEKAEKVGKELGVPYSDDINVFLRDPSVEVMYIVTPTGLHCRIAEQCLKAGKHVLLTKPIDASAANCDNAIALAKKLGLRFGMDYDIRQEASYLELQKAIENKWFGKILNMYTVLKVHRPQSYFLENGGWRGTWSLDGGGSLSNQGIHEIDRIITLLGMPSRVRGSINRQVHDIEAEDIGFSEWEYKDGAVASFMCTTSYPANIWFLRVEVYGTEGAFILTSGGPEGKHTYWMKDGVWNEQAPYPMQRIWKQGSDRFAYGIRMGTPVEVTAEQGRCARVILDAIYESASKNSVWVDIHQEDTPV